MRNWNSTFNFGSVRRRRTSEAITGLTYLPEAATKPAPLLLNGLLMACHHSHHEALYDGAGVHLSALDTHPDALNQGSVVGLSEALRGA